MKQLPRVPVWLILLPLIALALSSWFGQIAAQEYTTARAAYAAAPVATSATPSPTEQSSPACPSAHRPEREGRQWHGGPWGGFRFGAWASRYSDVQSYSPHRSRAWHFGHGGLFHH